MCHFARLHRLPRHSFPFILFWSFGPLFLLVPLMGVALSPSLEPFELGPTTLTLRLKLYYTLNSVISTSLMSLFLLYPEALGNRHPQFESHNLLSNFPLIYHSCFHSLEFRSFGPLFLLVPLMGVALSPSLEPLSLVPPISP
jgi:hypothetical protein